MTDVRPLLRTDTKGPVYYLLEMSGIPFGLMTDTYGWGAPPHGEPNLACKIVILSRFVAVRLANSKKHHYFSYTNEKEKRLTKAMQEYWGSCAYPKCPS